MRTYKLSFGESIGYKHPHPERTARRSLEWDTQYQVWPNRASMITSIRMQRKAAPSPRDWRALEALSEDRPNK